MLFVLVTYHVTFKLAELNVTSKVHVLFVGELKNTEWSKHGHL